MTDPSRFGLQISGRHRGAEDRRAMIVLVVPPERRLSELDSAVERFPAAAGKDVG